MNRTKENRQKEHRMEAVKELHNSFDELRLLQDQLDEVYISTIGELKAALEQLCYALSDNEIPKLEIKKAYENAQNVLKQFEKDSTE